MTKSISCTMVRNFLLTSQALVGRPPPNTPQPPISPYFRWYMCSRIEIIAFFLTML